MSEKATSTVVTSSITTEAVVSLITGTDFVANDPGVNGVAVICHINVTASATAATATYKIRQGNGITGTTIFTGTAIPFLTGVLTQSHTVAFLDTSAAALAGNPLDYSVTATGAGGTLTINSATATARGVTSAQ